MNDGTDAVYKVVEYTVGSGEFVIPEDPDRGLPYLFNGWYLENIGGEEFDFATLMEEGGNVDVTLYAQWLIKFSAVIRSSDSGYSSVCPNCGHGNCPVTDPEYRDQVLNDGTSWDAICSDCGTCVELREE